MNLGVVNEETWGFFQEIYEHLAGRFPTRQFTRRATRLPFWKDRFNRRLLTADLNAFLRANDVVFFEWASELLAAASHLPKSARLVTRLHRYELYQWAGAVNWNAVDRIILVSQAKQREFSARFPAAAARTVVIPEAIDLTRFQPHGQPYRGSLGILCHLTPRKRVYELILAFSELARLRPDLRLTIGGGKHPKFPDYLPNLAGLVDRLDLNDRVTFSGPVADARAWYTGIDLFISNSYNEGLQVSPMEAIASGCDCLSHHWDGADELLPADRLYQTEAQLIERVLAYCDLPQPEKDARQAALRAEIARRFDVCDIQERIAQVIAEAAGARA
jgi:glycosyltransferase involved in cell wall biosynthesis